MKGIAMADSAYREVKLRDGRTLAYAEYGSPSGQPIIYCHGVPSSRVEADLIVDGAKAAALNLRIIVPDRPGMGRSDYQPGRRIVDWPDDVLATSKSICAASPSFSARTKASQTAIIETPRIRLLQILAA